MNSNGSVKTSEQLQQSLEKLLNVCLLQRVSAEKVPPPLASLADLKWEQLTRQLLSQNSFREPLTGLYFLLFTGNLRCRCTAGGDETKEIAE